MKLTPKISGEYKISDDLFTIMQENPGKGFRKITIDTRLKDLDTSYVIKALNDSSVCICDSYEDALYINELINKGLINVGRIELKDDLEMKDRSYIDFKQFKKTILSIPTSYYMWGVKNIDESKSVINQKSINEIIKQLNFSQVKSSLNPYENHKFWSKSIIYFLSRFIILYNKKKKNII